MGKGEINKRDFIFFYCGGQKQGQYGVGFLIRLNMINNILGFKPVNKKMAYLKFKENHSPNENSAEEDKDRRSCRTTTKRRCKYNTGRLQWTASANMDIEQCLI